MKYSILILAAAMFLVPVGDAVSANAEYKLTRIQYTATDGVRYDTARTNLHIVDSQAVISSRAFWLKAEIVNGNYFSGDRDVFEKYRYRSADGKTLRLVNSKGEHSRATILRTSPLRIKFDTGVILNFRQVAATGVDRNPQIKSIQTVNEAIDDVVANEIEIGQIGF